MHPLIADGGLVSGWTISEPATGCRIAYGCTIAETRAQLTARIAAMGGTARFLAEIENARATILGSTLGFYSAREPAGCIRAESLRT